MMKRVFGEHYCDRVQVGWTRNMGVGMRTRKPSSGTIMMDWTDNIWGNNSAPAQLCCFFFSISHDTA